jgi:hypothetical protein
MAGTDLTSPLGAVVRPFAPLCLSQLEVRSQAALYYAAALRERSSKGPFMSCRSCGSKNQTPFTTEMSVHVLGLENVNKPVVLIFPSILVCMDCGFTELAMAQDELRQLGKGPATDVQASDRPAQKA